MKHFKDSTGKEVFDLEIKHSSDPCDSYVYSAVYDDLTPVPEDELDYLTETYADYIYEEHYEHMISSAESACEGDR